MPAAQWVPACAGMTADGVQGDKGKVSLRDELIDLGPAIKSRGDKGNGREPRGDKRMPAAG